VTWRTVSIADAVTEAKPGFACGDNPTEGVFQFRMNNVTTAGTLDLSRRRRVPATTQKLASFLLEPGDVLFNATNSPDLVGKSAFFPGIEEPAVFSNHFVRLRPRNHVDGRFLARWLSYQYQLRRFEGICRQWVNQATVGRDALLKLSMPLPPLDEQRRIAEVLDRAEALLAKRREAIAHLDEIAQSIFLDMFGDPVRATTPWATTTLAKAVKPGTIVTYGIVQAGDEVSDGVPYIRTGDIVGGEVSMDGLRRTAPEIAARFGRSRVQAGDIVMSIRATVGTTAMIPRKLSGANLTQGTARIAPSDSVQGPYLLHMLRAPSVQQWIERQVKGATFREITLARLRDLPVLVPPTTLQHDFATRIAQLDGLKAAHRASLTHLDTLFASLQHRAFRGEL